jgi:hypothetical protein
VTAALAAMLRDRALARMADCLQDAMAAARDNDWEVAESLLTSARANLDRARESARQVAAQSAGKG